MKEKSEQQEQERLGKAQTKKISILLSPSMSHISFQKKVQKAFMCQRWWETTRKPWLLYPGG